MKFSDGIQLIVVAYDHAVTKFGGCCITQWSILSTKNKFLVCSNYKQQREGKYAKMPGAPSFYVKQVVHAWQQKCWPVAPK